jgi:hypothetical protein
LASEFKKSEYHDVHKESFSTIRAWECDNCDLLQL